MDLEQKMRQQWDTLAESWISEMSNGGDPHREGLLDEWMLNTVGDVSGVRVIDLGCGEGRFCRMLAERGAKAIGVDLCEPFIEFAVAHRVRLQSRPSRP